MIMPYLIINTYVSLVYELKKNGKVFASKFVGTGPLSYEKRIYRAAVSQRLRDTDLQLRTITNKTKGHKKYPDADFPLSPSPGKHAFEKNQ